LVAVACFFPGWAKDLSPPRYSINATSTNKLAKLILKDCPVSYVYAGSVNILTEFEAFLLYNSNYFESEIEVT